MPDIHEIYMQRCIQLALLGAGMVAPNPMVGAVLVYNDRIIGEGYHRQYGAAHAEVNCIQSVAVADQVLIPKSTIYVSLEPCCHQGRTGPCTDAIINAGISRVVVAVLDPDPLVAEKGVAALTEAGIAVEIGDGEIDVREQLAPYFWHRHTGRPYVILKMGATLDGRTAMADGTSQWITSAEARRDAHELRADSDAIVVGAGTVRADDPELPARDASPRRDPLPPTSPADTWRTRNI